MQFMPETGTHTQSRAQREAEVLLLLKERLHHPHIIDVLFAFEETLPSGFVVMNLIFPYCRHDLHDLLYDQSVKEVHQLFAPPTEDASLLSHGLWEAIVNIVGAVHSVHNLSAEQPGIKDDERVYAGHFDLKPGNIVVDVKNGKASLLLTDFGNAEIKYLQPEQSSGLPARAATPDYAPPESSDPQAILKKSYDTWSLGCILLEVMVFVTHSNESHEHSPVRQFSISRQETRRGIQDAAFWCGHAPSFELRKAVKQKLWLLREKCKSDPGHMLRVIDAIETKMLRVTAADRKSLIECMDDLQGTPEPRFAFFFEEGQKLIMPRLAQMYAVLFCDMLIIVNH
jgi:serine/threonine protein kinase